VTVADPAADPIQPTSSFVRSFFRHGATYAFAGMLSQGIAFLLFPFFAHVFSPRDYGIIDLIGLAMNLVNLTVALEISQGLGRFFPESTEIDDREGYASTAFIFTVIAYTVSLATCLVFIRPLTTLVLGSDVDTSITTVALAAMWCSGMLYLTQDLLRWQLRPKAFAAASVTTAAVTTASSAVLVLGFHTGVIGAIIGQLIGFGCAAALAYTLSLHLFRLRVDAAKFRRMITYSLPLIPASLGVFLNGYADRVAIRVQLTLADVGVYGAAYRLSIIASLTLLGFQGALLPLVLTRHEEPQTRRDVAHIFRLFCAISLLVFLAVSLFADELLRILTRPAFYSASDVVPLLVAAAFFGGMYVFAPGPYIARRTRPVLAISVISGGLNAALAFVLARPLGIRGPALAFLIATACAFAALMIFSQRTYHVPHEWRRLLLAGATITGLVAVGRIVFGGTPDVVAVLGKLAFTALGCGVVAALLLTRHELVELGHSVWRSQRDLRSALGTTRLPRRGRRA
jgi:O-antigen/teichoic acid export membrane protein